MRPISRLYSLLLLLALAVPAAAKFILPQDAVTEPALKATVEKLKTIKDVKDAKPIFDEVQKAADAGSAEAQFALGFLLQSGLGVEQSNDKAKAAYQKALEKGIMAARNNLGLLQASTGEDPKKSIGLVEDAATAGYAPAQVSMGQLYLEGMQAAGITKDLDQARVWLERAEGAGDADGALALGQMYEQGVGVPQDQAKALSFYQKMADRGNAESMIRLGAKLIGGQGIKGDPAKGKEWIEKAVAAGAPGAKTALAQIYESGTGTEKEPGIPRDLKKAYELYTQVAESGEASAYLKLGAFHEQGAGMPRDEVKAVEFYKKGAAKNVAACIHQLALFHAEGKGGLKKDDVEAFNLLYRSAMMAYVPSQIALALRYRQGTGAMQDAQAALAWLERAMQNGNADAAVLYASMLEAGEAGVRNLEVAVKIFKEAAGKGHPAAMMALGSMLEDGRGLPGDFRQALMLYLTAAKAGLKEAGERADKLKKSLSPEQLKMAEAYISSGGQDAGAAAGAAPAPVPEKPATTAIPTGTKPVEPKPVAGTPLKPPATKLKPKPR